GGGLYRRGQAAGAGDYAGAQARDRATLLRFVDGKIRRRAGRSLLRPAGVSDRDGGSELYRLGSRDDRGDSRGEGGAAAQQDRAGHLERVIWTTGGGTRSTQLGDALSLRAGRARPRDRQFGEARTLSADTGRRAPARRGPDLVAGRGPDRGVRSLLQREEGQA